MPADAAPTDSLRGRWLPEVDGEHSDMSNHDHVQNADKKVHGSFLTAVRMKCPC